MIVGELHPSISWAEFDHNICDFACEGHLDAIYCIAIPAIVDVLIDYALAESLGSPATQVLNPQNIFCNEKDKHIWTTFLISPKS